MPKKCLPEERGQIKAIEAAIKGWLQAGIHPHVIAAALNNAFFHGEAIAAGGQHECDDQILGEMYEGIDKFRDACDKVE